ncbi:MAG: DUF4270 domain-containing protein [Bacteroidia bacterium]|jgi:hypothetical protein|nr:DUF4270 domain-containing protein [Bacteroidia bacterium]
MIACWKGKTNLRLLSLLATFIVFVSSCKKENTVGSEFVGGIVGFDVQSTDTLTLLAYTSKQDSFRTRNLSLYTIGKLNDPDIGTTQANIITQLTIPADNFTFPQGVVIDSIVVQLQYASASSFYGTKSTDQTIQVYELNETLLNSSDSGYYSNRNYTILPSVIGSRVGNFSNIGDSVIMPFGSSTLRLPPHIRIKLSDPGFVSKIASAVYSNNATFQSSILKGLYIATETTPLTPGAGALVYCNLNTSVNAMVVYYNDSFKVEFPISRSTTVKANQFFHQHTVTIPIEPAFGGTPQLTNYAQPMGGLKTRIFIPNLFDLVKDKNIAITGAEILFTPKAGMDNSTFTLPNQLLLTNSDSLGRNELIRDAAGFEGAVYYGGKLSNGTYRFNIIRHIQYVLNEYKNNNRNVNYGLNLLVPADNPVAANRIVLDTDQRLGNIKLKLSYTVIK